MERKYLKQFAENATNNGVFGSYQEGTKILSNDVAIIQSLNAWLNGWNNATVSAGKLPTEEEFQGIQYVLAYFIKYLYSLGIAEWAEQETYKIGSIVNVIIDNRPNLYYNITGNNGTIPPNFDNINWQTLNQYNFTGLTINTPVDFNTYTQQGNYNLSSNLHTNAPIDTEFACNLQVLTDGSTLNVVQLVQDLTNSTSYVRYRLNDIWGNWLSSDANLKANTDLSNLTLTGKETIANLGMPSNRFINLTATGTAGDYIAPANGYVYILVQGTGTCALFLNSPVIGAESLLGTRSQVNSNNPCCYLPCKKNDKVSYATVGSITTYKFVYAEGN